MIIFYSEREVGRKNIQALFLLFPIISIILIIFRETAERALTHARGTEGKYANEYLAKNNVIPLVI